MKKFILVLFLVLVACGTTQQPVSEQPTYQIVDNSQVTIVVGDKNKTTPSTESSTSNTPTTNQELESVTKSSAWIVWLVILGILSVGGLFVYLRYFRKR
jgi:hypothetical protein